MLLVNKVLHNMIIIKLVSVTKNMAFCDKLSFIVFTKYASIVFFEYRISLNNVREH
jgi:hypothetical protein